jgi:hypothetical protein
MRIDVLSYLSRATLDVIGLSGFGYNFDSLPHPEELDASGKREGKKDSELAKAFSVIFSSARKFRAMTILQVWFPFLRRFVSDGRALWCLLKLNFFLRGEIRQQWTLRVLQWRK